MCIRDRPVVAPVHELPCPRSDLVIGEGLIPLDEGRLGHLGGLLDQPEHGDRFGVPGMRGDMGPGVWRANPNFPNVDVINDTHIVVDQEPIFIPRNFTDKRITWQLPRDSRYRFDRENGVTVGPEVSSGHRAFSECKPEMNELRYTCRNDGTPGSYKYPIRVTGPASVPQLDPFIRNGRRSRAGVPRCRAPKKRGG